MQTGQRLPPAARMWHSFRNDRYCGLFREHVMSRHRLAQSAIALAAAALLAACGSKVSAENFERIQTGMAQKEVIAFLGEPTETSNVSIAGLSGGMATWRDGNTVISVQFVNDKVQAKQLSRESNPQAQ